MAATRTATRTKAKPSRKKLQHVVQEIELGFRFDPDTGEVAEQAPAPLVQPYGCADAGKSARPIAPPEAPPAPAYRAPAPATPSCPFGTFLLRQDKRDGWIGDLAKAAKRDPGFPKSGDPDEVRKRLEKMGADIDMIEAVDAAESEWLA